MNAAAAVLSRVRPRAHVLVRVALVSLAAYLLAPALNSVQLEVLSAQIQSIALALGSFGLAHHDSAQPFATEFIFYTRQGVSELLFLLGRIGIRGDAAFRLLTLCSLLAIMVSSIRFARDRGGADWRLAFASLLLTPGLVETAFYFNDNIVSAAFACAAMAIAAPAATAGSYLVSGVLLGAGVLCRLDAIFVLPFIVGLAAVDNTALVGLARKGISFALGAAIPLLLSYMVSGATPFDTLKVALDFASATRRWIFGTNVSPLVFFFGLAAPIPVVLGAATHLGIAARGRRRLLHLAVLGVYPVVFVAYVMRHGHEVRYMYPLLAPLIALYGAVGLKQLLQRSGSPPGCSTRVRVAWLAMLAWSFVLPPLVIGVRDGPRALTGRLYMPVVWWRWQQASDESMRRLQELVARAGDRPRTVVVSTDGNDEFFLKLRLMEAGYTDVPVARRWPGCEGFTLYEHGGREVLQVRLNNNWRVAPFEQHTVSALVLARAFDCPALHEPGDFIVTRYGAPATALDWKRFGLVEPAYRYPPSVNLVTDYAGVALGLSTAGDDDAFVRKAPMFTWAQLDGTAMAAMVAGARSIAARAAQAGATDVDAMYAVLAGAVRSRVARERDVHP